MPFIDYQTRQIQLSSGVHAYCDVGDSEHTILLLHGFAFRPGMYPLVDALKSKFRVVVPDLPFSTNHAFLPEHSLDRYVDFLMEFVQKLGLGKISIFGNSVGGTLALMCGIKHPLRFYKLVVRCPLWSSKQLPGYLQIKPLVSLHQTLSKNEFYARSILNLFYRISSRMSPKSDKDENESDHPGSLLPYHDDQIFPVVLSRFLGHLIQVEFESSLNSIPSETLILWGALDSFVKSEWGGYLSQVLPDSQYIEMSGEYHNIATAHPNRLATVIFDFVSN